jgi:hypothetical protein
MTDLEGAYESALNAEGSSLKENETYLDTIQGRIDLLNNAMQTMWMNFTDSDTIKFFVDLATSVIKLVDAIGMIPTVTGLFVGWKQAAKELEKVFGNTSVSTKDLRKQISDYIKSQNDVAASSQRVAAAKQKEAAAEASAASAANKDSIASQKNAASNKTEAAAADAVKKKKVEEAAASKTAQVADDKEALSSIKAAEADELEGQMSLFAKDSDLAEVSASKASKAADDKETASSIAAAEAEQLEGQMSLFARNSDFSEASGRKNGTKNAAEAASGAISLASLFSKGAAGAKALGVAGLKGAAAMAVMSIAMEGFGAVWQKLDEEVFHRAEHIKSTVEDLKAAFESTKEELDSNLKTLTDSSDVEVYETLKDEFAKLARGVDQYGNNISLTSTQYERYKEICEQIAGVNPEIAAGYDNVTRAIGDNVSILDQLIELQKTQARENIKSYLGKDNLPDIAENAWQEVTYAKRDYWRASGSAESSRGYTDTNLAERFQQSDFVKSWNPEKDSGYNAMLATLQILGRDVDSAEKEIEKYFSRGTYDSLSFFADHMHEIYKNTGKFENDGKNLVEDFFAQMQAEGLNYEQSLDSYYALINDAERSQQKLSESRDGLLYTFLQAPLGEKSYEDLNNASKKFISNWINNSEAFKIDQDALVSDVQMQLESGVYQIQRFVRDLSSGKIKNDQITGQDLLDQIYDFDMSTVNWIDYQDQIAKYVETMWDMIGGENNQYGIKNVGDLSVSLGFNFIEDGAELHKDAKLIQQRLQTTADDINNFLFGMTAAEVQAFYKIEWNDIDPEDSDTKAEIMQIIHDKMKAMQDTVSAKTYSAIVADVESYNESLLQTSEIVSDNIEVTQEYKNSLMELGISKTELNKYFYENNELVVKDANGLNKLVKSVKNNIVQNVKLAKSQAKLEYYELYKKMKQYTKGAEVTDKVVRSHINSLYEQMKVIQGTITKYSILEAELLGAANAYQKLEDAQAADEAMDYGSKAEELMNILGTAFRTAELGTQAAKVAIEGLIPDEVIDKTKTLDEQMQEIYDYFTKGEVSKLFTITTDDEGAIESVEMTRENVEAFTESLIGNRKDSVFQGTWDRFTLNPEIQTLEDFRKECGLTEEVAFAFLTELEKYDIGNVLGGGESILDQLMGNNLDYQLQKAIEVAADVEKKLASGALKATDDEYVKAQQNLEAREEQTINDVAAWQKKQQALEEQKELLEKYRDEYEKALEAGADTSDIETNITNASEQIDSLFADLRDLEEPTEFVLQVAVEESRENIANLKADIDDYVDTLNASGYGKSANALQKMIVEIDSRGFEGIEEMGFTKGNDGIWRGNANMELWSSLDGPSKEMVRDYLAMIESEHYIDLALGEDTPSIEESLKSIADTLQKIANLLNPEYHINLLTDEAETRLATFKEGLNGIKDKRVNVWTNFKGAAADFFSGLLGGGSDGSSSVTGSGAGASGNQSGVANAHGSWGAPKTETSLVGELGPEILVRGNQWTTVGDNGAEFTQVKKGDIIFNHKQTESLLKNGYVTGRGKAYASGTSGNRKWFESGAFRDGWQFGDLYKTLFASELDLKENVTAGLVGMGEKMVDAFAMMGTAMHESAMMEAASSEMIYNTLAGNGVSGETTLANYREMQNVVEQATMDFVGQDLYDESEVAKTLLNSEIKTRITGVDTETDSLFGDKVDGLAQSVGEVAGTAALTKMGVPWWLTSGSTAFGGEAENALNSGATFEEANLSALVTAAAEVLTEQIGGITYKGNPLSEALSDKLTKEMSSDLLKKVTEFGLEHVLLGEGTEEAFTEAIGRFGQWLTYQDDKTLGEMLTSKEARDSYIESYIGGFVLGEGNNLVQNTIKPHNGATDMRVNSEDDLVAMHNMTVEKFLNSYQQGGMMAPSVAIVKRGMTHNEFGGKNGVRVELPLSSIDPSLDPRHKVYGADAYTPVVGDVDGVMLQPYSIDAIRDIRTKINNLDQLALERSGISDHPVVDALLDDSSGHNWDRQLNKFAKGVVGDTLWSSRTVDKLAFDLSFVESVRRAFLEESGIQIPTDTDYSYDPPVTYPVSTTEYAHDAKMWMESMLMNATNGRPEFASNAEEAIEKMYQLQPARKFSSLTAPEYTSIDQIIGNSWRLSQDADGSDGGYNEHVESALERILLRSVSSDEIEIDRWNNPPIVPERIQIAESIYEEGVRGIKSIKSAFADAGEKLSIFDAYKLSQLFTDADSRKVNYFEAKPRRVVPFSEATSISVPEDFPVDVLQQMIKDGLNVVMRNSQDSLQHSMTDVLSNIGNISDSELAVQSKKQEIDGVKNKIASYVAEMQNDPLNFDLINKYVELIKTEQTKLVELEKQLAELESSLNKTNSNGGDVGQQLSGGSGEEDKTANVEEIVSVDMAGNALESQTALQSGLDKLTSQIHNVVVNVQQTGDPLPNLPTSNAINGGLVGPNGTAHATGSSSAPKTETALVGELGPEMLVRNGRWTTVGDNGAEFTQVRRGDIIFNHKQTEDLLSKGYVNGRGKMHGGAFVSGTAYAFTMGTNAREDSELRRALRKQENQKSVVKDDNNAIVVNQYNIGTSIDTFDDYAPPTPPQGPSGGGSDGAKDEAEDIFDWIEVRLEEINEDLDLYNAKLENAIGAIDQNEIIDEMIKTNNELRDNLLAGAEEYYRYSETLLAKIPEEYRKAAQDGKIAIEEFAGDADQKTLEAIQEYREWVQKGADATQQAEEVLTEIQSLAKQAFDNIVNEFENKLSLNDSKQDRLDAENSLLETDKGFESENIYQEMIRENESKLELLEQQRNAMQAELDSGRIEKYSDAWYEAVNAIAEVDTEIVNITTDNEDLQDSINELHWAKFDLLMKQFEAIADEAENLVDILRTDDVVDEFGKWTDKGVASLGLFAQKMEVAEMQAQQYKEEIEYLNENWQKLGYTQEEYVDKLDELKSGQYDAIKAYHDAKDAIVDLNKERVDAIKEGIEKEIDAYEELINKKKEALDADKDAHDWQKSVADQQKNISDIERQIAALSADNSISARAKRAQLEAELLEAKAEMDEMYYDRTVEKQKEALDKELESFQETKEDEIENWEKYLENVELVVSDTISMVQESTQTVLETLTTLGQEFGLTITEALTNPWKAGENAIQYYGEKLNMSLTQLAALFGLTVDDFAAKLDLTTEGLVSKLDITVAEMATSLGLTEEQLAAKLGLTTADLSGKMSMTIQQFASSMGYTIPELAQKLGTTTSGLVGNLNMTMTQFAGRLGLTVDQLAGKFGLTTKDLASKLGQTYKQLTNPFGMTMSSTVDALKSLEKEYQKILNNIESQSLATVSRVNHAMDKYTNKSNNNTSTTSKSKTVTLGSRINAGSAKIYSDSYGGGAGTQYYGNDPIYTVIGENNGYWLVRYHKLSSGYTGWFKKSDVKAYAKGTKGVKEDQLALIDELGEELQLVPRNGRLAYLQKGTSVIPADLTENLMGWGKLDPSVMLDQSKPQIGVNPSVVNNTTEIHIDASVGELLHVEHLDGNNPAEITKIVDKAWDKRMKELNGFVRKYSR